MNTKSNIASAEDVVTTIRLPREQHERIKAKAQREHRTFSQQIRHMIALQFREEFEEAA